MKKDSSRKVRNINGHIRTRDDHSTEFASDYVEAVEELIRVKGECRLSDLAGLFQISNASAHRTIARLKRIGLVESEPYRPIQLTKKGQMLASRSRDRHRLVIDFLIAVGVPRESAEIDSEGIEHHVSADTEKAIRSFLDTRKLP